MAHAFSMNAPFQFGLPFDLPAAVSRPIAIERVAKKRNTALGAATKNGQAAAANWRDEPMRAFEVWLQSGCRGRGFSERSQVVYLAMWRKLVQHCGRGAAFSGPSELGQFLRSVTARGRPVESPTQQRRYLALVAQVQDHLIAQGALQSNAARQLLEEISVRDRGRRREAPVALRPSEESALRAALAALPTPRWHHRRNRALIELALGAGLKVAELQALRVRDILRTKVGPVPGYISATSTAAEERRIPVAAVSWEGIIAWVDELLACGANSGTYVLISGDGDDAGEFNPQLDFLDPDIAARFSRPMSSSQIWRAAQEVFQAAGMSLAGDRTGPGILRNTFAVRQLRAGCDLQQVGRWLGHKDLAWTEQYLQVIAEQDGLATA